MVEIKEAPKEVYIDGSNPMVFFDETEQMKEDRLLAEALQMQMDEELAKEMKRNGARRTVPKYEMTSHEKARKEAQNQYRKPKINHAFYKNAPAAPSRATNIGSNVTCVYTFKTRGSPNETIRA